VSVFVAASACGAPAAAVSNATASPVVVVGL
jgi:hypothetical protein